MKAIIVDDEQPSIDMLKVLLAKEKRIEVVGSFRKPKDALAQLENLQPDVAFLDIHMPVMNGLELAEHLSSQCPDLEIVFTTAHDQYALDAFQRSAIDYLLKPVTTEAIQRSVQRLYKRRGAVPAPQPADVPKMKCFGEFNVYGTNGLPLKWRTAKTEELMAYLHIRGDVSIPKWDIIADLWPECTDEQAHSNLHTTMYKLKKTLKDAGVGVTIMYASGTYNVDMRALHSDRVAFKQFARQEQPVSEANDQAYFRMIDLYKGELYEGRDYTWSLVYKEQYFRYFRRMSNQLSLYLLELGRYDAAADIIKRVLSISMLDEDAHELLLRIYFEHKDRISFIRHYDKMSDVFQRELGLPPKQSTRDMYETMMRRLGK